MSIKEEIAKNILFYRKKYGYTQSQLGKLLGVRNTSVSNWETGDNSIDIETLIKLCKIFNVELNDMYGPFGKKEEFTEKERKIIEAYRAKPGMQPAVDTLLLTENNTLANDMKSTIEKVTTPTKQK
ncbi:MAG: helix-turn-helix transcriptional regulator [Clostridia bacterium]|nr:helix-turn-helix transcriptional regulator [Clostridia bacterium]